MKNKKFIVVSVYGGYGEMSINSFEVRKGRDVDSVCDEINEENRESILEGCESEKERKDGINEWYEFYNYKGVSFEKDYGWVGGGEENFNLVLGEKNEYYNKMKDNGNWNEEEWNKWVEFCMDREDCI